MRFSATKPSDLIPELQGRFPIRVELDSLGKEDFIRILTEPHNALVKQYIEMLATENLRLSFTEDAVAEIAEVAAVVNERTENIGARRLYTIMRRSLTKSPSMRRTWKRRTSLSMRRTCRSVCRKSSRTRT